MSLHKGLKKLEDKRPPEKKVMVVKFGNEVIRLKFGGQVFNRLENETQNAFI